MAPIHRKLFPTNITDCELYPCHPSCLSSADCYPYPIPPDPDFFFPLPPPPPLPPSSSTLTLSPYLIISLSVFALVSVLVIAYVVIVKRCFRSQPHQLFDEDEDFIDHNHGPEIDHPIWYINTIGLQPSVINSIAVFKYKKGNAPIEGNDCPVCLSEFDEDQTLRLLPKCNHAFHIACIDTWLRSHTNCPLCRAGIISNSSLPHSDRTRDESTNSGNNSDVWGNSGINNGNGEETEVAVVTRNLKEIIDFSVINLGRENGRRSVSMDCSMTANICVTRDDCSKYQLEGDFVNHIDPNQTRAYGNLRIGSSSSAESLHMSPISMKRSFSCGGRLFSSTRYNNCKGSSSILPL